MTMEEALRRAQIRYGDRGAEVRIGADLQLGARPEGVGYACRLWVGLLHGVGELEVVASGQEWEDLVG
jgi:hypothetical protein